MSLGRRVRPLELPNLESPVLAPGFRFLRRIEMRNEVRSDAPATPVGSAGGHHG